MERQITLNTDSNLYRHAEREIELAGGDLGYDKMINEAVLDIIGLFGKQGHSGMSAGVTTAIVGRLMRFEPLTPLTGADDEWTEVTPGTYQNKRCSHVFKEDDRAYDIDVADRPTITFPYSPE